MRKIYLFLMAILLIPVALFAQELGFSPGETFLSIPTLVAAILFLTDAFKNLTGYATQYVSWIIALLLAVVGYVFNLGIFNHIEWWVGLIYAMSAGLIANGLFDWPLIKRLLHLFKLDPASRIK